MLPVVCTERAEADLDDILFHLFRQSKPAARRLAKAVNSQCRLLGRNPGMGRDRSDLLAGLRSVVVESKYVILFRVRDDAVRVMRVIHGARHISASLFDED